MELGPGTLAGDLRVGRKPNHLPLKSEFVQLDQPDKLLRFSRDEIEKIACSRRDDLLVKGIV